MPPSQGRQIRGLEHRFSCKVSVYQLGHWGYQPSTRHTHELVHTCLVDRGVPSVKGEKKPPLPAQSANRLRAGRPRADALQPEGKDTHCPASLG